jgi:hypothetical protein
VNIVSLLLLLPVGEEALALLLLPAPLSFTKELELLELLLAPPLELSEIEEEMSLLKGLLTPDKSVGLLKLNSSVSNMGINLLF